MANEQVSKLDGMIERIEQVGPRDISVPAMMASGYLLALHDGGLVSEEEWLRYDHAIDEKAGTFVKAAKEYALGVLDQNGMAVGWHPMSSKEEAIKQAHTRSMESSAPQCIMLGAGVDDEDGQVEFLVVGGEFYKRHDL